MKYAQRQEQIINIPRLQIYWHCIPRTIVQRVSLPLIINNLFYLIAIGLPGNYLFQLFRINSIQCCVQVFSFTP